MNATFPLSPSEQGLVVYMFVVCIVIIYNWIIQMYSMWAYKWYHTTIVLLVLAEKLEILII